MHAAGLTCQHLQEQSLPTVRRPHQQSQAALHSEAQKA